MTTIIANREEMGGDTFVDVGYRATKLWRCKRGVFGCAGDDTAIARFEDWMQRGRKKPVILDSENFEALQLHNGTLYVWGAALRPEVSLRPFHAVGSGAQYALGAMSMGATIEEALAIAAEFEPNTKGPFEVMRA